MSEAAINIAIAQLCGWKRVPLLMNPHFWIHYPSEKQCRHDEALPDYCKDLNAMHEAEKMLSQKQIADYVFELHLHVPDADLTAYAGRMGEAAPYFFPAIHATARQRAEAFLRVFGKWKEDV